MFDLRSLPPELQVSIRLAGVVTAGSLADTLTGIERTRDPRPDEPVLSARFATEVHDAEPGARVEIAGVELAPRASCAAYVIVRVTGPLPAGSEHRFDVQQISARWEDELGYPTPLVGGSTFVVRIAGEAPEIPAEPALHEHELVDVDILPFMPPWMVAHVERQQLASGKRIPSADTTPAPIPPSQGSSRLHMASVDNIVQNWSYLDDDWPAHGDPTALLHAGHCQPAGDLDLLDRHPIGLWYDEGPGRWAVFNEDLQPMSKATFAVLLARGKRSWLHHSNAANTAGNSTYLDHPNINGDPHALLTVTPSWGPAGGAGVYLASNIGTWYDDGRAQWAIFTQDLVSIPVGVAFTVTSHPTDLVDAVLHVATGWNTFDTASTIDAGPLNGRPEATPIATACWNPGGGTGVYVDTPLGMAYDERSGRWVVHALGETPLPEQSAFVVTTA